MSGRGQRLVHVPVRLVARSVDEAARASGEQKGRWRIEVQRYGAERPSACLRADPWVLRRQLLDDRALRGSHRCCVWVAANVLAWPADIVHRRDAKRREHQPAPRPSLCLRPRRSSAGCPSTSLRPLRTTAPRPSPSETSENPFAVLALRISRRRRMPRKRSNGMLYMVEDGESWRAGYDSLEALYPAHEDRHPEIRHYAARAGKFLEDREEILRAINPADFETTPDAAATT